MGRNVQTNRQTKSSGSADHANQSYARINRQGAFGKLYNAFKTVRGKIYNG